MTLVDRQLRFLYIIVLLSELEDLGTEIRKSSNIRRLQQSLNIRHSYTRDNMSRDSALRL